MKKSLIVCVLSFVFLLGGTFAAQAATRTVTKTADTNDGVCNADCSLREAIAVAVGGDIIVFASPLFDSAQTIVLSLADFNIDKNLTINGRGMNLTTFSGNGASRLFRVVPGGALTLNDLTLTGGRDGGNGNKFGGAIINAGSLVLNKVSVSGNVVAGTIVSYGGGIYNDTNSSMTVTDSTISGNSISGFATDSQGAGIYNAPGTTISITGSTISGNAGNPVRDNYGIGIRNFGTMTITGSTISGNTVAGTPGTNSGGGIYNTGTATIVNTTISGNSVSAGNFSNGGGIYNGGSVTIINGTITLNNANANFSGGGGGVSTFNGPMNAVNTIISGNTSPASPDLQGNLSLNVNNFVGGDAKLASLGSNGGLTQTHALLSNSPALNAGSSCVLTASLCGFSHSASSSDQRGLGYLRNVGNVDIGSFESGAIAVTNANESGPGSLLDVVNNAAPGSVIGFGPLFTSPQSINLFYVGNLYVNKDLTIVGPGRAFLTLFSFDGNESLQRIFYLDGGATLNISGLTITDAGAPTGQYGGGVNINSGTLNMNDVTIIASAAQGGCIYNNGTLNLSNSLLSNCGSYSGGGIYNETGKTATVTNSTIAASSGVIGGGGGIYNKGNITVTGSAITSCITYNSGNGQGAGLFAASGTMTINNSTISGNNAQNQGGAAYVAAGASLNITNTTITNNVSFGNLTGGIFNLGTFTARNSIIAGNRNTNGIGTQEVSGVITGAGYNLLGSTTGNSYIGNTTGNIVGAANLAPLANYGGPTTTYALLPNSPAINAGDTTNVFAVDQRGSTRPVGGRGDIGSFERNVGIDQVTLPNGHQNTAFNQTLTVTRLTSFADDVADGDKKENEISNLAPFTFSIVPVSGQGLPQGLTLSSAGVLSGTPTTVGLFTFTVKATDTDGMAGVQQYSMYVFAPSAANVVVSGRISTPEGNGLRNAYVVLTDSNGNSRTTLSGSFGYFRFAEVEAGQTYIVSVVSKRFQFSSQIISVSDDITELNFTAQ